MTTPHLAPLVAVGLAALLFLSVGLVGTTRRIGFWWAVLLSILLTPIGGLLVAILSGQRRIKQPYVT